MDNTNQKKVLIKTDVAVFVRGLLIGKALTLVVIGGLLWWLLKPNAVSRQSSDSDLNESYNTVSINASTFESLPNVPIDSFNYGGSSAWAPIRQLVDSQILSARPELQLRYLNPVNGSPSSSSGIRMLLEGQLDFAQSSRPLTDEEKAIAKQRGLTLEQRQVGLDAVAVIVNPSLNIPGLTIKQLQQIYLGEINNWKQVGGPDLAITPLSQRLEKADTAIFSTKSDFDKQALNSQIKYVYSTTEAVRQVKNIPGAVYYDSARAVIPQCSVKPLRLGRTSAELIAPYREPLVSAEQCPRQRNRVNTEAIKKGSYPITSDLFVIIKQNKDREQRAGEAYANLLLTTQGQNALEQAGFTGVRK